MMKHARCIIAVLASLCLLVPGRIVGGPAAQWLSDDGSYADNEAIRYATTPPSDAIARLQREIDADATRLSFDAETGYLQSVLQALQIPVASQLLVFSKTSFQRDLISPARPRALYFGPNVYVGWIPGAPQLEIASADPHLGAVFYTLRQEKTVHPAFQRETQRCLQCHESASQTAGVPGFLMKSVVPDATGEPILAAGTFVTTDQSPLAQRWGGWYVTAARASSDHMGNLIARDTATRTRLDRGADADTYLTRHSDIVALMVFAHQKHVQNLITRLNYRTRMAAYFDHIRNVELGRDVDFLPPDTRSLIAREAEALVDAMLFVGEAPLNGVVEGTSGFAARFAIDGPRDAAGRSLRDLDLKDRLFRYPCSYLIYSESFDGLPVAARDRVYERLWAVLDGEDRSAAFSHLTPMDRSAITAILLDTKPEFAAWRAAHAGIVRSR